MARQMLNKTKSTRVQWREITGTDRRYLISSTGLIYSNYRGKPVVSHINRTGYMKVMISVNGVKKTTEVHRLVALEFVPNPDNKPQVNHIDGNRLNNDISNLEWVTEAENIIHAQTIIHKSGKTNMSRMQILDTKTGKLYKSSPTASKDTGVSRSAISSACLGKVLNPRFKYSTRKNRYQQTCNMF